MAKKVDRVTLGFSVHTGWAALLALGGTPASPVIALRRHVEMIADSEREIPRFVYHAAQELALGAAERFVRQAVEISRTNAVAALKAVVGDLGQRNCEIAASGIIVGKPLTANLEAILKSHPLLHTAEGDLFRGAIKHACEKLKIPVMEIGARDLPARAARVLKISAAALPVKLVEVGRAAGRPWSKDQKDAFLVALLAGSA